MGPQLCMGTGENREGIALSGKIMLFALSVLLTVVLFMVGFHLYARCYNLRLRRRLRRYRPHIVSHTDAAPSINQGLEPAVLNSLPVFVYSSKTRPEKLECAVCLSEFEETESARLLPKCNHSFHTDCFDMWFHSHSTCPLCRSTVEPVRQLEKTQVEVVLNAEGPVVNGCEPCSSSSTDNITSLGIRRKGLDMVGLGVTIEVPRITEFELRPSSSNSLRSPVTRLLSFNRILSMNEKSPNGTSSTTPCGIETSHGPRVELGA